MDVEAAIESLAAELSRLRDTVEAALVRAEKLCCSQLRLEDRINSELHALVEIVVADVMEHKENRRAGR